jgi:putative membrane protein
MTQRPGSLADYLAAERTFLAWIRTGLALVGFGFVVARFGLFFRLYDSARPTWLSAATASRRGSARR